MYSLFHNVPLFVRFALRDNNLLFARKKHNVYNYSDKNVSDKNVSKILIMFHGRKEELKELDRLLSEDGKAVLLYGKRRVGKTELIKRANKHDKAFIYFECLEDSMDENVSLLTNIIKSSGIEVPSYVSFSGFLDIFRFLNSLNKSFVVAIDEYPFLKKFNDSAKIDSLFQNIIDNSISNIDLIISGSQIMVMQDLLKEGNPLFSRFDLTIHLRELNYLEASRFYPTLSNYDKVAVYSIFGGSPFINKYYNDFLSLKQNIINTFLKIGSGVNSYSEYLLLSDASNELHAKRILSFIANGKKKHKEIIEALDKGKTGIINRSLNTLLEINIIRKNFPINRANDSKTSSYEISDNVLRFYFSYVFKNKANLEVLGADRFYDEFIEPTLSQYISRRFEEICRHYFMILIKDGKLKNVKNIGTYYYDDPIEKSNGEFDVAVEETNGFKIYEAKYLKEALSRKNIFKEIEQINLIKQIQINGIGFVSINGFEDEKIDGIELIDGDDIYFHR